MSNLLLTVKIGVVSFTVLCAAMLLKLSLPSLESLAYSEFPSFFTMLLSWLKPPYLYVVINGIIITIVASSKFHHHKEHVDNDPTAAYGDVVESPVVAVAAPPEIFYDANTMNVPGYNIYESNETVLPEEVTKVMTSAVEHPKVVVTTSAFDGIGIEVTDLKTSERNLKEFFVDEVAVLETPERECKEFFVNEVEVFKNTRRDSSEFLVSCSERPPVAMRTSHRKPVKSAAEGGRALRVSKPKRQETLETTWKTITEGRSMPLTRHLRKSDTWESHDHHVPQDTDQKMTKSDTFHVPSERQVTTNSGPGLGRLRKEPSGSWKLKKDPSLSQDDLNRRVEAFINKFNEDMRLQRQESLQQYMQMINRGAAH